MKVYFQIAEREFFIENAVTNFESFVETKN